VRFSDSTGLPEIPDFVGDARPNGLAVRFDLGTKDGKRWHTDIIGHSVPHFPVQTGADFAQLLTAIGGSQPGTPSPTPIEKFLQSHPAAFRFVTSPKPPVKSFAAQNFYMLNAFKFIAPDGKETYIRYRVLADEGVQTLTDEEATAKGPNYLFEEVRERVKTTPLGFKLFAQIAEEGDTTNDITAEWPDDRKLVELGSLKVNAVVDDSLEKQKRDIFDPIPRVDGIEPSEDPILEFRAGLYLLSGRERRTA
jgi:catalase